MKKPLIITVSIFAALIILLMLNNILSKKVTDDFYAEVKQGRFEITVTTAGELMAENSLDIVGPEMAAGRDIRATRVEIQDIIPEGTIVRKGDYIAQLNRTELSNMLKDGQERLTTMKQNLEVKLLDTAVQLNGLRDQIKNQEFTVAEREMTLKNSKFESAAIIRQAEINAEQAKRILDQVRRNYSRRMAQVKTDIYNQNYWIRMVEKRVNDMEEVLADFTITAPADGMIIYKKEWRGNKRKAGSFIDPRDRVVATLPDLTTMISKIYVSETDISKIKKGQKAEITVDAFPAKAYKGTVTFMANIGEKLPNTSDKVFEVHLRLDGTDPNLRPSMTSGNKILIKEFHDAVFVPTECIQAGIDSIPFVYRKNGTRQIVITGEENDKHMIIEKGLEPGSLVYLSNPSNAARFRLSGEELIPIIRDKERLRRMENNRSALLQGAY